MEILRMDKTVFRAYNMVADGNIDFAYWFDKTHEEKLQAAASMISACFNEADFITKKVDRSCFSSRKHRF